MPTDFDLVAPRADALRDSLRATGYSLPDAVSDLIDNSITAGAGDIRLDFQWAGADSWVSILDDGCGMSEPALIDAMRIGSRSPRETREPSDLGRYGLGLKTASISQARSLTVATRIAGRTGTSAKRWDLDHLASAGDWQLLNVPIEAVLHGVDPLSQSGHGTLVLQRCFLNLVSFWPEIASRKARPQSCQSRGQVSMKRCSRSLSCELSL